MTNAAQEDLNRLFIELYQWHKSRSDIFDIMSCDRLALICLKITCILVDDQRLGKIIATHLSILFHSKKVLNAEEELKKYLMVKESDLEENLRGFSNLLNWVLENNILRRDPFAMLSQAPRINKKILHNFNQLSSALLAYFDLDDAFLLKAPKVPVVLFLTTFANIYDALTQGSKEIGTLAVISWLKERIKNDELRSLYLASLASGDFKKLCNGAIDQAKELLILLICMKVARNESIGLDEAPLLNQALNSIGMLGLEPLLHSGFLSLENKCRKDDKGLKIVSGS